jgi:hypothetical protein
MVDEKGAARVVGTKLLPHLGQESFFAADLGAGTVKWMHDACDYIARLTIEREVKIVKRVTKLATGKTKEREEELDTGRFVRRLRTLYHPNYAAGFRSCDSAVVPEYIEAGTAQELYKEVMLVVNGEKSGKGKYV